MLTVAPVGTWNVDPIHSRVDFEVSYLAGRFKGEFHELGACPCQTAIDSAGRHRMLNEIETAAATGRRQTVG